MLKGKINSNNFDKARVWKGTSYIGLQFYINKDLKITTWTMLLGKNENEIEELIFRARSRRVKEK